VQRILSVWIWVITAIIATVWLPLLAIIYLVTVPWDPGRYTVGRWFRRCAVTAVAFNPLWDFRTSGFRPSDPRRPYVAVSNHESLADIFLISHLPWEMKWLSKDAIFKLPIMGWMMRMAGDVAVSRSSRSSRVEALEQCKIRLDRKVSVMIFPEGTRSNTGELLPFKDGAFRLAVENGLPILPMAVAGTRGAMKKGSLVFGRSRAEVRVLEPIPTEGLGVRDVPALRDRVRDLIQEARDRLTHELDPSAPLRIPAASNHALTRPDSSEDEPADRPG
jgi:1-acyl-sn-glycerol-3-phosphate acyltransferase